MKYLQAFAYYFVIVAFFIHHIPILRASFEVKTDYYYNIIAKDNL